MKQNNNVNAFLHLVWTNSKLKSRFWNEFRERSVQYARFRGDLHNEHFFGNQKMPLRRFTASASEKTPGYFRHETRVFFL